MISRSLDCLVNCTGREVRLRRPGGRELVLPASPAPAELVPSRLAELSGPQGLPLGRARGARVAGLPPAIDGVTYLVEPLIAFALAKARWDVACLEGDGGLLCWDASPDVTLAGDL